jgi:NitT/TauT family transport system ATP-binding protein
MSLMSPYIYGVSIPDSKIAREITELVRDQGCRDKAPARSVAFPDELVGLLRTLRRLRADGGARIADLADAVPLDDERLLPLVRILDALGLAELAEGRVRVTAIGRRFAQAREDERKRLFADRLKSRMPLASHVLSALQAQPERQLRLASLERELRDEFAAEKEESSLRQIIAWGRYGGLFFYDDRTGVVSLGQSVSPSIDSQ